MQKTENSKQREGPNGDGDGDIVSIGGGKISKNNCMGHSEIERSV